MLHYKIEDDINIDRNGGFLRCSLSFSSKIFYEIMLSGLNIRITFYNPNMDNFDPTPNSIFELLDLVKNLITI